MPIIGWIGIGVAVVASIVGFFIAKYNSLVKKKNECEEAFATMDVYLKQRWDSVPNFVEIVKGYAKHEVEALKEITSLRTNSYGSMSTSEKIEANKQLSQGLGKLLAVAEAYPELKSNSNFQDLTQKLENVETHIANARKYYNAAVKEYNNAVQVFPGSIVAKWFKFEKMQMFDIEAQERENVKVKF